jgi:hypothetical protein
VSVLAIAPAYDRPGVNPATGRPYRDATQAFQPEAEEFARLHGGRVATFDSRANEIARLQETLQILKAERGAGHAAIGLFMHGFRSGMQCGFRLWNVSDAARALTAALAPGGVVALYACDAARDTDSDRKDDTAKGPGGAGGFASRLAAALGPAARWVDAHATAAHTTKNPHLRRFLTSDATDDGLWIVEPGAPAWKAWAARLQKDREFRLSFPFETIEAIRAGL